MNFVLTAERSVKINSILDKIAKSGYDSLSMKKKRNICLRIVKKCRLEELITPKQVTLPYQCCIRTALVLCLFISLHQSSILSLGAL